MTTTVTITPSTAKHKRLTAKFPNKNTHFGLRGGNTYLEHNDDTKKQHYLKRHKVREDWGNYQTAGSLSRHILWNKETLQASIKDLNSKQDTYRFVYKP